VTKRDGKNLANRVSERCFRTDNPGERQTADVEDEHELERGKLLAWSTADHTYDQDQKEIPERST
jgi:hypothetical protein